MQTNRTPESNPKNQGQTTQYKSQSPKKTNEELLAAIMAMPLEERLDFLKKAGGQTTPQTGRSPESNPRNQGQESNSRNQSQESHAINKPQAELAEIINERKYKMPKKVLKITTHLPAIPNWLKINNSINFPLPLKSAKELAKKLLEVQEDVEIEIHFATGKETTLEIEYEPKKDEEISQSQTEL